MGGGAGRGVYSLNCIFDNMVGVIFLLELLSSHIMFYSVGWVGCLYSFFPRLISILVASSIIIVIVRSIYMVGVIGGGVNIDSIGIVSSSNGIIIISNTNLFTDGVRFKLGMGL